MSEITFGKLKINLDLKEVFIEENSIKLTKLEYNILTFLLNNRNKIFSREELIDKAWSESVSKRAVDTAISRLRSKLASYGKHLITRLGFGYGFIE